MCKNYFRENIRNIGFSNLQKFLAIQTSVKKVVLIIIKTKDFLRIVFTKNFLVKFLYIERKIAPKRNTVKFGDKSPLKTFFTQNISLSMYDSTQKIMDRLRVDKINNT